MAFSASLDRGKLGLEPRGGSPEQPAPTVGGQGLQCQPEGRGPLVGSWRSGSTWTPPWPHWAWEGGHGGNWPLGPQRAGLHPPPGPSPGGWVTGWSFWPQRGWGWRLRSPDAAPSFLFLEKEGPPCRPWEPAQRPPRDHAWLPAPEWPWGWAGQGLPAPQGEPQMPGEQKWGRGGVSARWAALQPAVSPQGGGERPSPQSRVMGALEKIPVYLPGNCRLLLCLPGLWREARGQTGSSCGLWGCGLAGVGFRYGWEGAWAGSQVGEGAQGVSPNPSARCTRRGWSPHWPLLLFPVVTQNGPAGPA